jgi:hypothetical protein
MIQCRDMEDKLYRKLEEGKITSKRCVNEAATCQQSVSKLGDCYCTIDYKDDCFRAVVLVSRLLMSSRLHGRRKSVQSIGQTTACEQSLC